MKKIRFFYTMKVRTSLILVLLFFLLMLVAGAGLGLWSLYANNQTLQRIAGNQAIDSTLSQSIDQYKNVQTMLGRALAGYVINHDGKAPEVAGGEGNAAEAPTGALGLEAQGYVKNRSEEHTSELQSLMRNSYAVFCLKKKK